MGLYANRAVVTMCMLGYLERILRNTLFCSPKGKEEFFPNIHHPEVPTMKGWCGAEKKQQGHEVKQDIEQNRGPTSAIPELLSPRALGVAGLWGLDASLK